MSQTIHKLEVSASTQTVSPIRDTHDDSLRRELLEHVRRLRLILPVISVSVMALRRQHACEPLDSEIERMESLLASLVWRGRQEEVRQ